MHKANKKHKTTEATSDGGFNNSSGTSTEDLLPTELQGDMVFENGCLFLRDALLTRLLADAIKSGDSGVVILVLKHWVFSYRGNGRAKYAHEMLHLFHNLVNVWTKEIRYVPSEIQYQYLIRVCRKVVTQNWLLNPTGKPNAFVEIDLVQEHLNFWIKVSDLCAPHKIQSLPRTKRVYKAEGGSHSWDWLALVSPCVDILRRLSTKINLELGTEQGSKHTIPDLRKDIEILMAVLKEHDVYQVVYGRVVDTQDRAVQDVISVGLAQLSHGNATNPIGEFNEQFERLRDRRKLVPVWEDDIDFDALELTSAEGEFGSMNNVSLGDVRNSEHENSPLNELPGPGDSDSETDQDDLESPDAELEAALMESPTLQRVDEDDVALDMDGWDLDGNSEDELSDEGESEEEEGFDFS